MKIIFFTILVFFLARQQCNAAVVRKQPAFATPFYSNSYLPAAMQVIFHSVDQLKFLQAEEDALTTTTTTAIPTTSPHAPGQHQPSVDEMIALQSTDSTAYEASTGSIAYSASTISGASVDSVIPESSADSTVSEASLDSTSSEALAGSTASEESTASTAAITGSTPTFMAVIDKEQLAENAGAITEEKPKFIEELAAAIESETPEENYATPEMNHEVQEAVQEMTESNQEIPEKNEDDVNLSISSSLSTNGRSEWSREDDVAKPDEEKNSSEEDAGDKSSSEESKEENSETEGNSSSKSDSEEDDDSSEEEDDEIRFTMIGEKVNQVPRPSLSNYLRKTVKAPLRGSVQDLAMLYDALSKDARKQGLGKYSGYSDGVLQTLESTMEGGVGPQLRNLLEKARQYNELTREDTKSKVAVTLKKLADPASTLSTDLRRLIPLRYIP